MLKRDSGRSGVGKAHDPALEPPEMTLTELMHAIILKWL